MANRNSKVSLVKQEAKWATRIRISQYFKMLKITKPYTSYASIYAVPEKYTYFVLPECLQSNSISVYTPKIYLLDFRLRNIENVPSAWP